MFCFVGCFSEENAVITPGNRRTPPKFLPILFDLGLNTVPVKTVDYKPEQRCFVQINTTPLFKHQNWKKKRRIYCFSWTDPLSREFIMLHNVTNTTVNPGSAAWKKYMK